MNSKRRLVVKGTLSAATVGVAAAAGLLNPRMVLAAWPKDAFQANSIDSALQGLSIPAPDQSGKIQIKAPDIAENGAVVPVKVEADFPNVESISIFVEANNTPLTSTYKMANQLDAFIATRVKMSKTSNIVAVVNAGGKTYRAAKEVKVTIGGCGG